MSIPFKKITRIYLIVLRPGFQSHLYHSLTLWLWTNPLTCLSTLGYLICKMGMSPNYLTIQLGGKSPGHCKSSTWMWKVMMVTRSLVIILCHMPNTSSIGPHLICIWQMVIVCACMKDPFQSDETEAHSNSCLPPGLTFLPLKQTGPFKGQSWEFGSNLDEQRGRSGPFVIPNSQV